MARGDVTWDWGDGVVETTTDGSTTNSHRYDQAGDYQLSVSVEGDDGETATAEAGVPIPHPLLTMLTPNTAEVGSEDVEMHVEGEGFTDGAVIVFNGGDEPTVFVDDTEVTTIVRPVTASGPWTVPVYVRNPDGAHSASLDFTFTETGGA